MPSEFYVSHGPRLISGEILDLVELVLDPRRGHFNNNDIYKKHLLFSFELALTFDINPKLHLPCNL